MLLLIAQLAVALSTAAPEIRPNDNRVSAGRARAGLVELRFEAQGGVWFPEGKKGPGVPTAAFAEEGKAVSGLVMGIRIAPRAGERLAADPVTRRSLRLFVTQRSNVFGAKPGFSFILQEGDRPPASDSVRFPSSTIVLRQHEPTAITVLNTMQSGMASVHWHGIELDSYYDGVAGWGGAGTRLAPVVAPGDSFVVRITPDRAGTFIYHTHTDEAKQLTSGLYGPLIVLPEHAQVDTTERVLLIGDPGPTKTSRVPVVPFVNGSASPPPIELRAQQVHRVRFVSISGAMMRRVRLVSDSGVVQQWRAVSKDGAELPSRQATFRPATVDLGPGETADFEVMLPSRGVAALEVITSPRAPKPMLMRVPGLVR